MGRLVPEYAGVKYWRIEREGLQTPVWDDDHPGTPYLFTETFPSGRGKFQARIEIHPADAARLKMQDGEAVRVSSRRGAIVLRAWVTERTTIGVVFVPMHFAEAAANLLTIDALDPLAKIPEYKACAVNVAPAANEELGHPERKVQRGRY